jgi:putative addiction module component (TIGR02574 family)
MPTLLQRQSSPSLAEFPELARLSKARRLKLADELWMSGIGDETPVPQWHQETLERRWADYQAGKTKRLTLKQLEQRLAKR